MALTSAAPTVELQHPSPVNPNVLVEVKPEEKIVLITDPKEIAKFKREIKQPLYPTVLPNEYVHHIAKRDHKPGDEAKYQIEGPKTSTVAKKAQVQNQPISNIRNLENVDSTNAEHTRVKAFQKPQPLAVILASETIVQEKPDSKINDLENVLKSNKKETHEEKVDENVAPQGQSAIYSPLNKATQRQKRDFSVPYFPQRQNSEETRKESNGKVSLVANHHHPKDSPKVENEEDPQDDKKVYLENQHMSEIVPTRVQDHEKVEEMGKVQDLLLVVKVTTPDTLNHKRDIPVPLVPKHHHPEESPKEEFHEEKKEVNLDNQHESQTLAAHIQDYVSVQGLRKPQIPPSIVKEIPADTQQHKRDIIVPAHTQEHIVTTDFQKPQLLPIHDKHIQTSPTTESLHQKQHEIHEPASPHQPEEPPQKSNYNKIEIKQGAGNHPNIHNVQVQDLSESKPFQKHIHPNLSIKDDPKPNILNAQDFSTTSTTEHPIFKNRPVPVSELFAR